MQGGLPHLLGVRAHAQQVGDAHLLDECDRQLARYGLAAPDEAPAVLEDRPYGPPERAVPKRVRKA